MTDGFQVIVANAARGGIYVDRLAKSVSISTSAGGAASVTLPSNPILNRDYPIQVGAVASPVLLYAAAVGTDATSTINGMASAAPLTLAAGSRVVARYQ